MLELEKYKIKNSISIRKAIKQLDEGGIGFCVCIDYKDRVIGVMTDGDFRRAILDGLDLNNNVEKIVNRKYIYVQKNYTRKEVDTIFSDTVARQIPVLDGNKLVDIITEKNIYGIEKRKTKTILDKNVVIMAGGKGTRLDPFTRILPKPLIPLGNDPVIKVIMDEFGAYGMKDFYVTLNDKKKMIKAYFQDHDLDYNIKFIEEEKPLGTAGSLKFMQRIFTESFFVSNCDNIIRCNYGDIVKYHQERKNSLTLVGSIQHHTVPYGVCEIENGGDLISIREKPEYDFLTNTGLYIIEPFVLSLIPDDTYFDMTDLIGKAQESGLKVGVFPVSEKSWIDVGQWAEYKNISDQYF